jgi:hypothetical protein
MGEKRTEIRVHMKCKVMEGKKYKEKFSHPVVEWSLEIFHS